MATILIVESYPNLASLYRAVLSEQGHHVLVAASCKEANDIAAAEKIELVIMDEALPKGCEEGLLKSLKTIQPRIRAVLCPLDQFSPRTWRELCDEGFLKTSDYTILQQKIDDLSRKISSQDQGGFF